MSRVRQAVALALLAVACSLVGPAPRLADAGRERVYAVQRVPWSPDPLRLRRRARRCRGAWAPGARHGAAWPYPCRPRGAHT